MWISIQNCKSHLYRKKSGEWTDRLDDAEAFKSSISAMRSCVERRVPDAQVVLKFPEDAYDVTLPVSDECRQK
jgi:hypothetical protein